MSELSTDIIDKDRPFRVWGPEDLYNPATGTGFVPNKGNLIKNPITRSLDEVTSVNYTIPSWETEPFGQTQIFNQEAILGGHYPLKSDKYLAYVDTSKLPASLVMHDEIIFKGPDVHAIRLFRGNDISDLGEILSGYYVNGILTENYLPVKTVSVAGAETVLKKPMPGSLLAPVRHGEAFTFVVYSDNDRVVAIGRGNFVVTNMVMALETPSRTVLDIKLKSPFIVDPNSTVLTLPINIPLDSIPLSCEIRYNDGIKELPVDGSRVILNGLRNAGAHDTYYLSSNAGHTLPLTLTYNMAKGESYAGPDAVGRTINRDYKAVTENVDGAYSMKLFVVPKWLDSARGWRLTYFLYNLTRGEVYDATAHVNYTGATVFDPLLKNYKQRLNVNVDISKVNPNYRAYIHPQSFAITLMNDGNEMATNFLLEYIHDQPALGENLFAKFKFSNVTYSEIDVSCGFKTKQEWLKALYEPCYPLYDRRVEDAAPAPTHFEIHVGGYKYTFPVDEWGMKHVVNYQVTNHEPLVIRWIARTPTDTLQIGLTSMLAHFIT